jgi:hypothetical protein
MRTDNWASPITIEDPESGVRRTVRTVRQAKLVLDRYWPSYHGSQYRHAEELCDEALHGEAAPVEARQAFIAAAVEAHMHLS